MGESEILIRYSEIGLKGKNRENFEDRLIDRIHQRLRLLEGFPVKGARQKGEDYPFRVWKTRTLSTTRRFSLSARAVASISATPFEVHSSSAPPPVRGKGRTATEY